MNELEVRGLKDLIKEYFEEESDFKTRLDELEEDVRELQSGETSSPEEEDDEIADQEDEEDEELPEEEPLEDNPERQVHEEKLQQASEKPSGTRINKEDMNKLQVAPKRKLPQQPPEMSDEAWDEE